MPQPRRQTGRLGRKSGQVLHDRRADRFPGGLHHGRDLGQVRDHRNCSTDTAAQLRAFFNGLSPHLGKHSHRVESIVTLIRSGLPGSLDGVGQLLEGGSQIALTALIDLLDARVDPLDQVREVHLADLTLKGHVDRGPSRWRGGERGRSVSLLLGRHIEGKPPVYIDQFVDVALQLVRDLAYAIQIAWEAAEGPDEHALVLLTQLFAGEGALEIRGVVVGPGPILSVQLVDTARLWKHVHVNLRQQLAAFDYQSSRAAATSASSK